jgi:hypothetical protein
VSQGAWGLECFSKNIRGLPSLQRLAAKGDEGKKNKTYSAQVARCHNSRLLDPTGTRR